LAIESINRRNPSTVLHPANSADLALVLNNPLIRGNNVTTIEAIIFSGGHGDRRRPGQLGGLNFGEITVRNNNLSGITVFFPDCELGVPASRRILETSLGGNVTIHAFDFNSHEPDVADFIFLAADHQDTPHRLIDFFGDIRRSVFFGRPRPQ